jgi:hypothetical protein
MSAGKAKGTRWETAVVTFLRSAGFAWADRVPLSGARDRGDVTVGPGSPVIECKSQSRFSLAEWLDEATAEAGNAAAPFGVVWFKRRGRAGAGDGYVLLDGATFAGLLKDAGFGGTP